MIELSRTQSKPVDDLSSVIIFCGVVHTTTQLFSNRLGRANSFRRPFSLECEADFCPGNRFFLSPVHCCWQQHPWCFRAFPARMTREGNTAFPLPNITAHNIGHDRAHQWSLLPGHAQYSKPKTQAPAAQQSASRGPDHKLWACLPMVLSRQHGQG